MKCRSAVVAAAICLLAGPSIAEDNLLFILDSSNSMWGQIDGEAKIETAKVALGKLISDLPAATNIGLMAYGHRSKSDCGDIELVSPIGTPAADVEARLRGLQPTGKTPMAGSLQASAAAFEELADGGNNSVVLISDGIESCGGDPCAAAGKLVSAGLGVKVHVVGFDIPERDRKQLECIAEKGGGEYFTADSTEGFDEAVTAAVEVAQAPTTPSAEAVPPEPVPPAGPVREQVFFEDFEGGDLAEDWVVHNPDPNACIVEDGNLLMLSSAVAGLDGADTANIIQLGRGLPDGDWDISVKMTAELKTAADRIWVGLREDEANFLAATITREGGYCGALFLSLLKMSNGEFTQFDHRVRGYECDGLNEVSQEEFNEFVAGLAQAPLTITLSSEAGIMPRL